MTISDVAIKRPVFTTMVIGAVVVFGAISFRDIGVDLFPKVEFPIVTVISTLRGADPETIETTVTDPLEEAVSTISGIKDLRSTSSEGVSQLIIRFELEKNIDIAYQEIQARISAIRSTLPRDLDDPVIEKFDVDSAPILAVVVSGDKAPQELTRIADKIVKERIQKVQHVGGVKLVGDRKRQIWLWLNRDQLAAHSLSVQDVENALRTEHVEQPGGRVETGRREYVVKTKAEFQSAAQFEKMVVAYRNGAAIRLSDIGRAEDGMEEERSLARLGKVRAIGLLVRRQSGTNTVEVATNVKKVVGQLRKELKPLGIRLEIAQDSSVFIEHSVHEVQFHLLFGGGLAVLIVLIFLRNIRSTFISSLVLPTSVVGTFIAMNAMGFTQNMMTLLALSLAIGLLIDDAIVVQENIMRHVEEGLPPREAAGFGTREIMLAVLATTLSVVAVFIPVAFMKGIIGRFFFQFGLTVAFAVLISMVISFTLDPMLSSRLLRKPKHGKLMQLSERGFQWIERWYERLLGVALRWRWLVILLALATFMGSAYMGKFLRTEFLPLEDQSEFNIKVKAPLGSSIGVADGVFQKLRQRLAGQPWLDYTFVTIGADELKRVNEGAMYVRMVDKQKRKMSQSQAMAWVRQQADQFGDVKVSVEIVPRVSGSGFKYADIQLELRGRDLDKLESLAEKVMAKMRAAGGYTDLDTSFEKGKPEVTVKVNKDRAADLGVNPAVVASAIRALIGGADISKFRAQGDRYDVSVRLEEPFRNRPSDIEQLTVRNNHGQLVTLDKVTRVKEDLGPVQINRYNRARQITVFANLQRDKKVLGEALKELDGFVKEVGLPAGYTYGFVGMAETMRESFQYLIFALVLAVVMVYMVLAAQFESFLHPLTIMLSLPLSIIGALGALVATGETMTIFTMIGVILLMGLVTKNGILLVDYTNVLRERDKLPRNEAVRKAGPVRLRPILMTTFAMIFGMLPIALGTGAGSESRSPMAIAVIGGLVTSTLLTLVVVPVVYTLIDDLRHPSQWRIVKALRRRPRETANRTTDGE